MTDQRDILYTLSKSDAEILAGACGLPVDLRQVVLRAYVERNGVDGLVNMFAQFMGMANAVVANNREAIEMFGIIEKGMLPRQAEQINLPTIFGACQGAIIAQGIDETDLCHGCAFRLGTCANQSPVTACDADYCSHPGEQPFMCHEDLDERGEPTKGCVGFAQLRAVRKRAA